MLTYQILCTELGQNSRYTYPFNSFVFQNEFNHCNESFSPRSGVHYV